MLGCSRGELNRRSWLLRCTERRPQQKEMLGRSPCSVILLCCSVSGPLAGHMHCCCKTQLSAPLRPAARQTSPSFGHRQAGKAAASISARRHAGEEVPLHQQSIFNRHKKRRRPCLLVQADERDDSLHLRETRAHTLAAARAKGDESARGRLQARGQATGSQSAGRMFQTQLAVRPLLWLASRQAADSNGLQGGRSMQPNGRSDQLVFPRRREAQFWRQRGRGRLQRQAQHTLLIVLAPPPGGPFPPAAHLLRLGCARQEALRLKGKRLAPVPWVAVHRVDGHLRSTGDSLPLTGAAAMCAPPSTAA